MKAVELELGGQRRRLAFDFNASIALQEATGDDMGEVLRRLQGADLDEALKATTDPVEQKRLRGKRDLERTKLIRLMVWAMVQTDSPEVTLMEVGSWLSMVNLMPVMDAIGEVVKEMAGGNEFEGQLAPYVPTPMAVVQAMVRMAGISDDTLVIDMGAGDGRLLYCAYADASRVTAIGYEAHQGRYDALREAIASRGLAGWVQVKYCDIQRAFDDDARRHEIQKADVVFLYLLDASNMLLRDRLRSVMKPGARLISHDFRMGDWEPEASDTVMAERIHKVYRWVI